MVYRLGTGEYQDGMVLTAELGSCQLEYKYLAQLTGRAEYYTKVSSTIIPLFPARKHSYSSLTITAATPG